MFKELFTDITWRVHGTVSCSGIQFFKAFFIFSVLVAATVSQVDHFGSIRYTIKSTVSGNRTKKWKTLQVICISELETVPWTPHVKSMNSPINNSNLNLLSTMKNNKLTTIIDKKKYVNTITKKHSCYILLHVQEVLTHLIFKVTI